MNSDFTEKNALVSMILTYEMFAVPLAAFFAAVLRGLGGVAGAFLLILVVTPIVGVKAVIPLISVFAACNNLSRVFIYRKEIVWRTAIYFTLASLPGVYFGAKLLEWMSESLLLLILGLILFFAIPLGRKLKTPDFRSGNKTIFGFGGARGVGLEPWLGWVWLDFQTQSSQFGIWSDHYKNPSKMNR